MSTNSKPELIIFSKADAEDPKNWSRFKKRLVCMNICALAFCAIFGSSIYATSEVQIRLTYGVGPVTSSSGLTLYVLGFSLGPLLCPMSEMYGRKLPYMLSWPLLILTSGVSAWAHNLPVILVFRFLAGSCAGCAVNNGGGIMSDMYNIVDMQAQAVAITWYAVCIFAGSCVALPIGFFIAVFAAPHLWPLRVFFFFAISMWPLAIILPESHGPTLLAARSKRLRKKGRPNARAAHEMKHQSKAELFKSHIGRPAGMFYHEPIVQGAALWTSLAYGIIYLYFELYPAVFFEQHHFKLQYTGLPFLALVIGILGAAVPYLRLVRLFQSLRMPTWIVPPGVAGPDTPESRLKLALFACGLMPVSLFWFAWSSGGETHWIVPTLAGVPLGFAVITIFFTFLTYTSQTYTIYASSSGACNTFARSLVAAIFPVASHSIIQSLGTKWGVSLLGFLSLGFLPIAFAFLRYGEVLRARSRYAREANGIVAKMRAQAAEAQRVVRPPSVDAKKSGETESEQFLMVPLSSTKDVSLPQSEASDTSGEMSLSEPMSVELLSERIAGLLPEKIDEEAGEASEQDIEQASKPLAKRASEQMAKRASEQMAKRASIPVAKRASEQVTKRASEQMAKRSSEPVVSEQMVKKASEQVAEQAPEQALEQASEQALEQVAEQAPEPIAEQASAGQLVEQPQQVDEPSEQTIV